MLIRRVSRAARKSAFVYFAGVLASAATGVVLTARVASAGDPAEGGKSGRVSERSEAPAPAEIARDGSRSIVAFAPKSNVASPMTVIYLHGRRGRAENGCPWMRDGATDLGWLVCPDGNERFPDRTFSWTGTGEQQRAILGGAEAVAASRGASPDAPRVVVGFSQGAFVAVHLMEAKLVRYRGVVLIGANVAPTRAVLANAGVERIVFAAGERDAAFGPMSRAATSLRREGFAVRFVSLGKIGHSYEAPDKEVLRSAITWAGGARADS